MDGSQARTARRRWARLVATGAVALLTGVATGCSSKPVLVPDATAVAGPSGTAGPVVAALPGTLAWDFVNTLKPTLNGKVGLALMPVGGDRVVALGDWTNGPAWSTMKVPLTLAALRANSGYTGAAANAITYSDNTAADTLWQSLGGADTAAQTVQAVLREGGDSSTKVPAVRTRSDYSAFGQADWSLSDQLKFASRLPCLPDSDAVTALMGKISSGQRWGLGNLDNAEFKGGWGPDLAGNYLVRQFGLIPVEGGELAIAIAAQPNSGSFDDGTAMLTKVANLINQHLEELRGGNCAR
ncbi:class A beta-lactamase-related serine hydrolase [Nocardia inohanensis]|uniref:class A beta-lactamase-related serine hydrolase n=1 Tax=Nocardia inohanensis TaxID=209246 RepID=UPI000AE8B813|nr:class A beta-lactamase-related serine hydrolase [Nocardia inohanensis]